MSDWSEEVYKRREKHEQDMLDERERVRKLFRKRGIPEFIPGCKLDRVVKVEQLVDHGCIIESTLFVIPEDIDLEKVIRWFVHDTKYGECTCFLDDCPPNTMRCDYDIDYFVRHYLRRHYLKKGG